MDSLTIDGSHGEGGGKILRTALSLSLITMRAFRIVAMRAQRRKPGLLPQHLSAVRAAAMLSDAGLSGDRLGATELIFAPSHMPRPGSYLIDVSETAERGSAGSICLVLQTLLVPLALADQDSSLVLRGGTHVDSAPPFDHIESAYLPILRRIGLRVDAELTRWGWYPVGQGEIACNIAARRSDDHGAWPAPIALLERGALRRITGRAVAANLPAHIPLRMADRARLSLGDLNVPVDVAALRVTAAGPGTGIFLTAEYETITACFSAIGRIGKPSETVADEAVAAIRDHHASGAAVEHHLADQLLLPLAFARGNRAFTTSRPTSHLMTNAWTIGQFGVADITIEEGPMCHVRIEPRNWR